MITLLALAAVAAASPTTTLLCQTSGFQDVTLSLNEQRGEASWEVPSRGTSGVSPAVFAPSTVVIEGAATRVVDRSTLDYTVGAMQYGQFIPFSRGHCTVVSAPERKF
jgi:hypothetical protein